MSHPLEQPAMQRTSAIADWLRSREAEQQALRAARQRKLANRLQRMDLVARLQDHELPQALREGRISIRDVPDARRSPALCMAAVLIYGGEIEHLRPAQRTLEVCVAALETYAHAIRHIRPEWRTDEMRLSAVSLSGYAIRLLSSEERTEPIILAALDRNPEVLEYLTHDRWVIACWKCSRLQRPPFARGVSTSRRWPGWCWCSSSSSDHNRPKVALARSTLRACAGC